MGEYRGDVQLETGLKEFFYGLSEEFHDAFYQSEHYLEYCLFDNFDLESQ